MTQAPTRAAIYARYSTDKQNPMSIEDQVYQCRTLARRKGWEVVEEYTDRELSSALRDRPGFQRLVGDLGAGKFDTVLAESMDRISRDNVDIADLWKRTAHHGIEIHTLDQGKMDFIKTAFSGIMGTMFLEALAEKTRRGQAGLVRKGKNPGGLPYGYRVPVGADGLRQTGELAVVPEEAAVIRRIFTDYAAGHSPLKIAARLNEDGIPAPRGRGAGSGHWKQNTLNGNRQRGTGILNNELYVGKRVWNRLSYRRDPDTRRRVSRLNDPEEWQVFDVPHLRILDDDLWNAVKERQKAYHLKSEDAPATDRNRLSASQGLRRRKYLLSGLLRCGLCGGTLTVAGSGKTRRYYCANAKEKGPAVCKGMTGIKQNLAEETVINGLQHELMQDWAYERFRTQVAQHLKEQSRAASDEQRLYERLISEKETTRGNLMTALKRGLIDDESIAEVNELNAELKRLRAKLDGLTPEPVVLPDDLPQRWQAYVAGLVRTLSQEEIVGRAADALHTLLDRVSVHPHPEDRRGHIVEIEGDIVQMLMAAHPEARAGYDAARCSLKLVAGVGFEPTTFRL
ncbi:recombinase family protein [Rhodovulum adriaticum]|uniref:recombinase family protein n=2 Tax=Rhodovulum adriaticum TaxID=35804 RepID=UPI00104B10E9|nr:hypothetical protein [Rhodovulum adriaticum]